jgi:regulator of cell morphogenesis and NO signaling
MGISAASQVKDIALSTPRAWEVLESAGIDYCCGGNKSLHDACVKGGVSAEELVKRLLESSERASPDAADWNSAALSDLTRHIRERHHGYARSAIPRIQTLLGKVRAKHGSSGPEILTIGELFAQMGQEMTLHMQKEEQILFPYIEAMERTANGHGLLESPFFQTVRNPIEAMVKEHDAAGDLVRRIGEASTGYAATVDACTTFKALREELKQFEADLHLHVHLENDILFPRAVATEAAAAA